MAVFPVGIYNAAGQRAVCCCARDRPREPRRVRGHLCARTPRRGVGQRPQPGMVCARVRFHPEPRDLSLVALPALVLPGWWGRGDLFSSSVFFTSFTIITTCLLPSCVGTV